MRQGRVGLGSPWPYDPQILMFVNKCEIRVRIIWWVGTQRWLWKCMCCISTIPTKLKKKKTLVPGWWWFEKSIPPLHGWQLYCMAFLDNLEHISWRLALHQSPVSWMFVSTSGTCSLSQNPESCSREAWAADWCSWIWQKYLLSAHVHSHPSSLMVRQILKPNVFLVEPRVREHRCISKTKVPVPCDHRVRRSRGDTCEGDWLLVVCCSVEGLLEHRQHWRDCRHKQEGGEESTWEIDS